MSVREASRTLTGNLPRRIEVRVGRREDGSPGATIDAYLYRGGVVPLADAGMVRELIADLRVALEHLDPTPVFEVPEGEVCGLCSACGRSGYETPCGAVHDCDLCEAKR